MLIAILLLSALSWFLPPDLGSVIMSSDQPKLRTRTLFCYTLPTHEQLTFCHNVECIALITACGTFSGTERVRPIA